MNQPIIADNQPKQVSLEEGKKYAFCACGHSQTQPFCDGSHKGKGLSPKVFVAEEGGEAYLCQCKQTGNTPWCDGTHKQFAKEQVGKAAPGPQG
ncbi:CDGSH iron-sulfur domain-containing protein [Halomonas sp.]|uniref:CDGSH iron-sulfur domain-containing protein n=1 Tax=Halomonas sp. TaxID=1486246 RepID=UPI00384EA111